RLCAHYGSAPQFICCSATNANPSEHLAALIGDGVTVIADDGAPQGTRSFVFWNPSSIERRGEGARGREIGPNDQTGRRRSTNTKTAAVLANLIRAGVKTLAFTRTRRSAELILRYTRDILENS